MGSAKRAAAGWTAGERASCPSIGRADLAPRTIHAECRGSSGTGRTIPAWTACQCRRLPACRCRRIERAGQNGDSTGRAGVGSREAGTPPAPDACGMAVHVVCTDGVCVGHGDRVAATDKHDRPPAHAHTLVGRSVAGACGDRGDTDRRIDRARRQCAAAGACGSWR